jgi:hypothetical protein
MKRKFISTFVALLLIIQLYEGVDTELFNYKWVGLSTVAEAATVVKVYSEKELIDTIYTQLLNRTESITVKYSLPDYELDFNKLFDEVLSIDSEDTAKDGDYLNYSLRSWDAQGKMLGRDTTLYLDFTYKTTQREEQAVDQKVKSVLKGLKLEDASDYKKVKVIHDYIINRVSYDKKLVKASAYDALISKSAVCEGYSMLAYLMFTEAGLETRIIPGNGNGRPHAWNIVKVKGKWYNIDLTWDDPISSGGEPMLVYNFFLKNTKDFTGHKRDAEYKTEEFVKNYPISKTSYKMK